MQPFHPCSNNLKFSADCLQMKENHFAHKGQTNQFMAHRIAKGKSFPRKRL